MIKIVAQFLYFLCRLAIGNKKTSVNVNEVSAIFKLPLTDCSYIERTGHFVVRILIPVARKDIDLFKLYKVSTYPFLLEDKICHLSLDSEKNELFLYDETTNNLLRSECTKSDKLCQVKEFENTVTDFCLRAIFLKDHLASKKYCGQRFQCSEIGKDNMNKLIKLPIVKKTYSDSWIVLGTGSGECIYGYLNKLQNYIQGNSKMTIIMNLKTPYTFIHTLIVVLIN